MKSKKNKDATNKNVKGGDFSEQNVETSSYKEFDYIQPIQAKPLEVKVYDNFDKAFKAFRALVQKERILSLYKEKQRYEKPSDKKRRKKNEMRRKAFELSNKRDDLFNQKKRKQYFIEEVEDYAEDAT